MPNRTSTPIGSTPDGAFLDHSDVRDWVRLIARIQFGTQHIGSKKVTSAFIKNVANRMATYADYRTGARVHPGIARLAVDLERDYSTVKRAVQVLERVGLLRVVSTAAGANATEYQLVIPYDLLDRDDIDVWSPARYELELERLRLKTRGRNREPGSRVTQGTTAPASPVDNSDDAGDYGTCVLSTGTETQGTTAPASPCGQPSDAGAVVPCKPRDAGAVVPVTQGTTAPATSQAPPTKPTTQPIADLKTAVTGPRATGADPPRDFGDKINPPTRAIGIAKLPNQPKNCHHGQPLTKRPDGTPRCTPCHRTATLNTPTQTIPTHKPLGGINAQL